MNLRCLIEVLEEKEIIEVKDMIAYDGKTIMGIYNYEYDAVFDKIQNSSYDENIIRIAKGSHRNQFCILNIKNLNYGLQEITKNHEDYHIKLKKFNLHHFPIKELVSIIEKYTKYDIARFSINSLYIDLIDTELRRKRIAKEKTKKEKVLNFLDSLP